MKLPLGGEPPPNYPQLSVVICIKHINMRVVTLALATLFAFAYASKTFDVSTRTTLCE